MTVHPPLTRFPVKAQFAVRQIKGEFILHDRRSDTVHRLNSVAGIIWQLCDGTRDRPAISAVIAEIYGKSPSDVAADVDEILTRFIEGGLVHPSGAPQETDLLLRCIERSIGTVSPDGSGTQLSRDVDWSYVQETASAHGVMPLVYRGLCGIQHDGVPADVLQRLEHSFKVNAERNRFLFQELLEVLAIFEANAIPAVPFKGPALAIALHGDFALRQFGDLDVFVPAEQAVRAKNVLSARGYHLRQSGEVSVVAEYAGENGHVTVDLQWAFASKPYSFPIHTHQFWDRVGRVSLGSASVLQPSAGDQLRILSLHAAKHCWSKLALIADIAAFIQQHHLTLNWRRELERSRQMGGERLLLLGASLAGDLLGAALPDEVVSAIEADKGVGSLSAELRRRLFAPARDPNSVRGSYGAVGAGFMYIRARERVRDKLPYVWHLVGHPFRRLGSVVTPNKRDRGVVTLPRYITCLYYLVRPVRLTADYWAGLMQRFHYLGK